MSSAPASSFEAITSAVIADCDETAAIVLTREVRRLRGYLDVFEAQLASHLTARRAEGLGSGAPPNEMLGNASGCSQSERDKRDRRAGTLDDTEEFADALGDGDIVAEHVDMLANVLIGVPDAIRAEVLTHEAELLDHARHETPDKFARRCRDLIIRIQRDHGIARAERQRANTRLSRRIDNITGMHHISGAFDPETGQRLFTALDVELAALVAAAHPEHQTMERDQLAAHAFANLVAAGHGELRPAVVEVALHVDLQTALRCELHEHGICELDDGTPIPPMAARRLLCDASVVPIIRGSNGLPLDAGRTRRQANREQRRALRSMYRTCAFTGCTRRFSQCHIHHIIEWLDGGPTDLDNLLPLCSYHHHMVHEGGWGLSLDSDRTLTIRRPDGSVHAIERIHIGGVGPPVDGGAEPGPSDLCERPRSKPRSTGPADPPARAGPPAIIARNRPPSGSPADDQLQLA